MNASSNRWTPLSHYERLFWSMDASYSWTPILISMKASPHGRLSTRGRLFWSINSSSYPGRLFFHPWTPLLPSIKASLRGRLSLTMDTSSCPSWMAFPIHKCLFLSMNASSYIYKWLSLPMDASNSQKTPLPYHGRIFLSMNASSSPLTLLLPVLDASTYPWTTLLLHERLFLSINAASSDPECLNLSMTASSHPWPPSSIHDRLNHGLLRALDSFTPGSMDFYYRLVAMEKFRFWHSNLGILGGLPNTMSLPQFRPKGVDYRPPYNTSTWQIGQLSQGPN